MCPLRKKRKYHKTNTRDYAHTGNKYLSNGTGNIHINPYPNLLVISRQSSGNPSSVPGTEFQCTLGCHWTKLLVGSVSPVYPQCASNGLPVCLIMQINTRLPLGNHCVIASASVVPVASQCAWSSSGLPVCSNYANELWIPNRGPLCDSISQCVSRAVNPVVSQCTSGLLVCSKYTNEHWITTGGKSSE